MIELVISGFQSGADIGGIRAANAVGLRTGGWMPRNFLTEEGDRPEYEGWYGAKEHWSPDYPPRTRMNITMAAEASGALFVFDAGERMSRGTRLALSIASDLTARGYALTQMVLKLVPSRASWRVANAACGPTYAADVLRHSQARVLCVAGNRESKAPGIGAFVEGYMTEVFNLLISGDGR